MVWAALTIILMQGVTPLGWVAVIAILTQGVIIIALMRWGVRSFGAFTSSLNTFTSTFLAAHNENAIMRSGTADLVERIERVDRHIRRRESLQQAQSTPSPDQEQSA